jgi:hypothetical protein
MDSGGSFPGVKQRGDKIVPIPVAERAKARVCGRSLLDIAVFKPSGGMDICFQAEVSTTSRSFFQRRSTDCDV